MIKRFLLFTLIFLVVSGISNVWACTNLIVTKGASSDGSVMITYAADSHTRYGTLGFYPATDHKPGDFVRSFFITKTANFLALFLKLPILFQSFSS